MIDLGLRFDEGIRAARMTSCFVCRRSFRSDTGVTPRRRFDAATRNHSHLASRRTLAPAGSYGQIGRCRKTPKTRCFKLSPAYLQARSAFVRKMEARLPARGHLAAEFFDLRTVKDSRGDRKHFPIFNRDVTLV